jgi:putative ABC transport system substrate-binding protein
MRRSVQSCAELAIFPLDKCGFPSAVNDPFLSFAIRDKKAARTRCTMKRAAASSILLSATLLAVAVIAEAQQTTKVYRIGYLSAIEQAREIARSEAIRNGLRERGYIEGRNLAIEYRYSDGKIDRAPDLLADLVRLRVDAILVAGGDRWIWAAKNATKTIPIVMMGVGRDPVEAGLIESLGRPGGNVTGITNIAPQLGGKRLELFKETVPKLVRVAVLYDPATPTTAEVKELLAAGARTLGLTILSWEVQAADDFEKVFAEVKKKQPEGLYMAQGQLMRANRQRIVGFTLKNRLPSMYGNRESVDAGGLLSYGVDPVESYRRVAYYVDRILKGAKAADLPVEQPTKFELVINLKTAKQIGLTIPQKVLARADQVIN